METITLTLARADAERITRLIRWRIRKDERALARSTFVPEPGRCNTVEVSMERHLDILGQFEEALGHTVQIWEDEVWVDA